MDNFTGTFAANTTDVAELVPDIITLRQTQPPRRTAPLHEPDELAALLGNALCWDGVPQPLTRRIIAAMWGLTAAGAGAAVAVGTVFAEPWRWLRILFDLATLGGHPDLTFFLIVSGLVAMLGLALVTRGFTQAGAGQFHALVAGAGWMAITSAGALLVLLILGLVAGAVLTAIIASAENR